MKAKKIIWIGPFLTKDHLEKAVKKGYRQVAANLAQQYIIEGIEKCCLQKIDIISAIRPPAFPTYKDLIVKKELYSHSKKSKDINVGFINIKYINHILRERALRSAARNWAKNNIDSSVEIIVYSLHSPFIKAALEIRKIIKSTNITVVVPDLPLHMDMSTPIQRFLKKVDWNIIRRFMKQIDRYILISKYMADYLQLEEKKWIVIEGMIDKSKVLKAQDSIKDEKIICLYMGTLKKIYKIEEFMKSFVEANIENAELHIYGNGESKFEVINLCNKYSNLKYGGYVSSDEAFQIMKRATLLVNPRFSNEEYTKYSCPSKIFEYMASGTPLLTTKLAGIPDEYFNHLYVFENEDYESMKKTISDVLSKTRVELNSKGKQAREFIISEKNNIVQAKKILRFIGVSENDQSNGK